MDVMAHVLDRLLGHGVHDSRDDFVEAVHRRDWNEHEEFLAAPAHDHVRFPQRLAQPARDRDQHGIAGCMPELVVDQLEVIEVDQQQRLHRLFHGAAAPVRLATALADEILEMTAIEERGQRIAAALEAQFAVLDREQAIGRP